MKIFILNQYLYQIYIIYEFTKQFIWMQVYCLGLSFISFMFEDEPSRAKKDTKSKTKFYYGKRKQVCHKDALLKTTDGEIKFPLGSSSIVITDIVESTRLCYSDPKLMQRSLDLHYKIIQSLVKKHSGHVVCNEGDSFQLVFKKLSNSIEFSKEFFILHAKTISYFQVRVGVGISEGQLFARRFCGYKVFGNPVSEILGIVNHNCGNCICIKHEILKKFEIQSTEIFCVH